MTNWAHIINLVIMLDLHQMLWILPSCIIFNRYLILKIMVTFLLSHVSCCRIVRSSISQIVHWLPLLRVRGLTRKSKMLVKGDWASPVVLRGLSMSWPLLPTGSLWTWLVLCGILLSMKLLTINTLNSSKIWCLLKMQDAFLCKVNAQQKSAPQFSKDMLLILDVKH